MSKKDKIIITGAAGLVGQNLVLLLKELGYENLVAIDKHKTNCAILGKLNPKVQVITADLAINSLSWQKEFKNADKLIILHAQITSTDQNEFERNNVTATKNVIAAAKNSSIPHCIHISSSVVNSIANDIYTNTKKRQEELIINSGLNYCILRPTLMFGWFDPKHFGWLSRFMEKTPIFPIPGNGKFLRQPLYSMDFCRCITSAMEKGIKHKIFDIVGSEDIYYIDIVKKIKKIKGLKTIVLKIPYGLFYLMLKIYALFNKRPPFTTEQLKALTAGDYFKGINMEKELGVTPTPLEKAFKTTYANGKYSKIIVTR